VHTCENRRTRYRRRNYALCRGPRRVEDAEDVHAEHKVKVVLGHVHRRFHDGHARICDEPADRAHLLVYLLEHLCDRVRVRDVALERLRLHAVLLGDLLGGFVCVLGRPVKRFERSIRN
jgi:hypothetical protein